MSILPRLSCLFFCLSHISMSRFRNSEPLSSLVRSNSNASALTSLSADLSPSDSHFFEVSYNNTSTHIHCSEHALGGVGHPPRWSNYGLQFNLFSVKQVFSRDCPSPLKQVISFLSLFKFRFKQNVKKKIIKDSDRSVQLTIVIKKAIGH